MARQMRRHTGIILRMEVCAVAVLMGLALATSATQPGRVILQNAGDFYSLSGWDNVWYCVRVLRVC